MAPCSYGPAKSTTTVSWRNERVFNPGKSPFGATVWAQGARRPSSQPSPAGRGSKQVSLGRHGHGQDLIHSAREHEAQTTAELGGHVDHILTIPLWQHDALHASPLRCQQLFLHPTHGQNLAAQGDFATHGHCMTHRCGRKRRNEGHGKRNTS